MGLYLKSGSVNMSDMQKLFYRIYNMNFSEISNRFEFLGEGISRAVFAINNDYVVKVAKGREGLYQSKVEKYVFTHCGKDLRKYLCPILWFKPDMLFMPRAIPLSKLTTQKYLDLNKLTSNKNAYSDIMYITNRFHLFQEDIISVSSWGIVDNAAVLIDYGCTSEEGDRYYDTK
jgi:hypothetical protein